MSVQSVSTEEMVLVRTELNFYSPDEFGVPTGVSKLLEIRAAQI